MNAIATLIKFVAPAKAGVQSAHPHLFTPFELDKRLDWTPASAGVTAFRRART